jgi:3-oxoacyl-[acyl-carrier-protein] synthase II
VAALVPKRITAIAAPEKLIPRAVLFPQPSSQTQRVVVTGAGVITAFGRGWQTNAAGFREGATAFRPVTLFDVARQRVKTAAEVSLPAALPSTQLSARQQTRLDRASKLLLHAAHEAWAHAGWQPTEGIPIVLGTTSGGMGFGEAYYRQAVNTPANHRGQASRVREYQAQRQALDLADAFGFSGPITIIANACASGGNAIGHAWHLIRTGQAERVLTGGYDALSQLVFSGFDCLQALSPTECRPFDAHRDGLALGEGAAVLTLESLNSARARGAEILAEISGYGASTDAHHLTQPHPQGHAALASMRAACRAAGVAPEQITYINAHGTGTPLNDSAEAAAINAWAGAHVRNVVVSSTKASIGHLLGAAGTVEALICIMALREGWLPPTRTTQTIDPACQFQFLTTPREQRFDYALSNSFGFGGANASVIFRRWS